MSHFKEPGKHSRLWKEWRAVGRGRHQNFFLEHSEAVLEALNTPMAPRQVLLSRTRFEQDPTMWEELAQRHSVEWYLLEQDKLNALTSVPSCGGVCGVFAPRSLIDLDTVETPFLLVTWEVQDPGNVGALVRSCAALAGGAVLMIGGCNPWSAKVARASAGALLRTPVMTIPAREGLAALEKLSRRAYSLYATVPRGGQALSQTMWSGRDAIVVGNETRGVPLEVQKFTKGLSIDMDAESESLNVAVAGSIACYEWGRRGQIHG